MCGEGGGGGVCWREGAGELLLLKIKLMFDIHHQKFQRRQKKLEKTVGFLRDFTLLYCPGLLRVFIRF